MAHLFLVLISSYSINGRLENIEDYAQSYFGSGKIHASPGIHSRL